ncbi:MAG: ABC transporter permease [Gammaproteobacteria bacterium]|nr:MAG: ABC transporter permease [Gammaproteobacteria bacterium]
MNALRLSLRMLRRGWRSGEIQIVFWALLIAVAGMAAVEAFTDRVQQALAEQASDLLGADLVLQSDHPVEGAFVEQAKALGLQFDFKTEFPSVARTDDKLQLGAIKAVGEAYPLRGHLRIQYGVGAESIEITDGPPRGQAWLGSRMLSQLALDVGDQLTLGDKTFEVGAVLLQEPDQATNFSALAPRVMIHHDDLAETALLQRGSRAKYTLLLAGGKAQLSEFRDRADVLLGPDQRLEDVKQARPQVAIALERADRFLALAAMVSVVLAGVAIVSASRRYLSRHLDDCAVLRCMGASYQTIFIVIAGQLVVAGLVAAALGVVIGYGAQFLLSETLAPLVSGQLPLPGLLPGLGAFLMGLALLLSFALPTLLQLRKVPALRVLRHDLGNLAAPSIGVYLLGIAVVIALMIWQAQEVRLVAYVVLGVIVAVALLYASAWLMIRVLRIIPLKNGYGWRLGLRAMTQRGGDTAMQLTACGIGLMVLLLFALIRNDLLGQWQASLPENAPNQFLINLQADQQQRLYDLFDRYNIDRPVLSPAVRGRLVAINGLDVTKVDVDGDNAGQRRPSRSLNLSFSQTAPEHSPVVEGQWWQASDKGLVSLEQDFAGRIGATIGDTVRINVAGIEVEAKVANLRKVEWDSFKVNFYMIFSPDVMAEQPTTYISSYYQPNQASRLVRDIVTQLPNVTLIDVGSMVRQIKQIIDRVTRAVEYVFIFTVAAGCVVLFAAIQSTLDQRIRHSALMRALGASRRQLRQANLAEFIGLGLMAGLVASAVATVVASVIASLLFDLTIVINPLVWLWGIILGVVLVSVVGFGATHRVLQQPPWQVLRTLG